MVLTINIILKNPLITHTFLVIEKTTIMIEDYLEVLSRISLLVLALLLDWIHPLIDLKGVIENMRIRMKKCRIEDKNENKSRKLE